MTDKLPEVSATQRIVLRPGDLVLVRYKIDPDLRRHPNHVDEMFKKAKETFRAALDHMGLNNVQVIVYGDDIDVSIISAVELLGALSSGVSADDGDIP